jgi:hypothetical protein
MGSKNVCMQSTALGRDGFMMRPEIQLEAVFRYKPAAKQTRYVSPMLN